MLLALPSEPLLQGQLPLLSVALGCAPGFLQPPLKYGEGKRGERVKQRGQAGHGEVHPHGPLLPRGRKDPPVPAYFSVRSWGESSTPSLLYAAAIPSPTSSCCLSVLFPLPLSSEPAVGGNGH